MIWKRCSRCKKRIPAGAVCECMQNIKRERDKIYDKEKRNKKLTAFYASESWIKVRDECRAYYCGLDMYELYHNNRIVYGRIAHHIVPIRDDWNKRYDADNLIYLSDVTHQYVHKQMDIGNTGIVEILKKCQKRWKEERGRG